MNPVVLRRLETVAERAEELERLLAEPQLAADPARLAEHSREYSELEQILSTWRELTATELREAQAREMLRERDPELRAMAGEELEILEAQRRDLEAHLHTLVVPADPRDQRNLYLEVRAGTGGNEAALFAGDLFRMYSRYAEARGWQVEILSAHPGEAGGYKEIVARILGAGAYSRFKFESGTHRVQRVPVTESQGRIHTSACTVAILPELHPVEEVPIDPGDLRIDTYRSSGAGGQHVNTTDSAVRITHLPTGIVVECQDERSQHKNRARALSLLGARLLEADRQRQASEQAARRRLQVGSGDRSERIRTYNFPQGRITDHRIGLTLYDLDKVLEGQLDMLIGPLTEADQADRLAELG